MEEINEICELYLDPRVLCSGQLVITAGNFLPLAIDLEVLNSVEFTVDEILEMLKELSKKFSACGANSGNNHAVLRPYKDSRFSYIAEKLKKPSIDC